MYSEHDFQIISEIVVSRVPEAEKILLFGSYATGKANKDSDLDIAVLLDRAFSWQERNKILNHLYSESARHGYNVDYLLKTATDFYKDSKLPTLSRVITREGKVLWTRT